MTIVTDRHEVGIALVVCFPHMVLSMVYLKALFLVLYYSSCIPPLSALSFHLIPVSYTHLTLPTNREV